MNYLLMKKTTILLGAGAMIPFGGPSTKYITDKVLVHESCKYICQIIQRGYKELCNFESLLSALELLLEWNLSNENKRHSTFQNTSIYRNVFQLATAFQYYGTDKVWNIYKDVVNDIIEVIKDYDYYPQCTQCCQSKDTSTLNSFISKYLEDSDLKIYTLNYDRLIPNLVRNHHEIYEGIDEEVFSYNLCKMIHHHFTYFNLHGSIYIDYNPNSGIKLRERPAELEKAIFINGGNPNEQKIFLPIIAGYHKSQRMMSKPFNFGLSAFMYDSQESNIIIIIGYSFGDPHINSILSNFVKTNNSEIIIVDYSSDMKHSCRLINNIRTVFSIHNMFAKVEDRVYENVDKTITIYLKGFDRYIKEYLCCEK